ncbi:septation protein SepH [Xylanimonas sp. McL0601]|uniref:septation protein SepH n=1 Tax=Xylanimonas sp. McL0601 TaxID=3414739 RepID=UPI003CF33C65
MAELELVRVHRDGGHLVLRAPDGTEHALPVTDALRTAVHGLPRPAAARAEAAAMPPSAAVVAEPALRPRDLQIRLRAGATAEELAAEAGMPVENVRRYEWPVIAEREHVIGMVRAHQVQGLEGASALGEVADARLAARGVPAGDATWSARREGTAPWVVEVRFAAGDRERSARWTFDVRGRVVTPLDDEARWLGQPDDPLTPEVRGVPSLTARRGLPPVDDETDLLLGDLAGRRGQRPPSRAHRLPTVSDAGTGFDMVPLGDVPVRERAPVHPAEPEQVAETTGASVVDLGRWNPRRSRDRSVSPGAGPGASQPSLLTPTEAGAAPASDAADTPAGAAAGEHNDDNPAPAPTTAATPVAVNAGGRPPTPARGVPAARRPARKGRAQVPSWDEIVFGARPDQ